MPAIELDHLPVPSQKKNIEPFSQAQFREAMGRFASGVVVITTEVEGDAHAMTANAFMSGSLEPPLVIVSVACKARMHEKIRASGLFGVSILANEQKSASQHFAGRPIDGYTPRFERLGHLPVLADAVVQIAADVMHSYACGDHTLFVGQVRSLKIDDADVDPLLYHRGRYLEQAQAA